MPTPDPILEDVRTIIAEILGIDRDGVTPEAHWELDLDGESLDVLDLSFRLERHFGVKIRIPGLTSTDLALDDRGFLTRESLDHLRAEFPVLELNVWETRPFTRPLDLITVGGIAGIVRSSLGAGAPTPAAP